MTFINKWVYWNTLTIRPRRLQAWYRRHPKFTMGMSVVSYVILIFWWINEIRSDTRVELPSKGIVSAYDEVEAEIQADPVKWYVNNGLTPRTTEEKDAFRNRFGGFYATLSDDDLGFLFNEEWAKLRQ